MSKSIFSHPCNKFLATAKVGLAHYHSFRGGGSYIYKKKCMVTETAKDPSGS